MKRQRSRGRGSSGGGGGGGGKPGHNVNRAFDSNGPDGVKIRGAAQHVFEKYQQLARDAASGGDRVLAENYMQHAEHYFRVLRAVQPNRPVTEIMGRDAFTSGIDIDFEDETGAYAQDESSEQSDDGGEARDARGDQRPEQRSDQPRSDQQRSDSGRGDYRQDRQDRRPDYRRDEPRSDNRQDSRPEGRPEGRQENRAEGRQDGRSEPRRDEQRTYRDDRGPRNEGRRDEQRSYRDDRPNRYEPRGERGPESGGGDPMPVVEPQATPLTAARSEEAASPTLRAHDGGFSPAPAFLQARAETASTPDAELAAPPKRRGRPPKVRADEAQPADASDKG